MGGSQSDLRKSRVPGMIGRKEAVKNGVDCHSVNLTFSEGILYGKVQDNGHRGVR